MKKTILTFGFISGAILSGLMFITILFTNQIGFDKGEILGYTTIVLSFLLVFFGIRSYRENVGDGQITFTKGFIVGISITVIASLCYVITWEILYYNFMHGFMDKYSAYLVGKLQASGASPAKIAEQLAEMKRYKELYENPLWNGLLTFIEPFPVGLVITLISAAILRKKQTARPAEATVAVQL